jgi:hypothetical protein
MSWSSLTIILQSNSVEDQVLTVRPNWDLSEYRVEFVNRILNAVQTLYVKQADLAAYLSTFLKTVYYDDDCNAPIEHVQLDIPGFPSMIVETCNLKQYVERTLTDQISLLQKEWPIERPYRSARATSEPSRAAPGRVGMCEDW